MRSLSSRLASETNNSGGSHGRSRWQSAEILLYCIRSSSALSPHPNACAGPRATCSARTKQGTQLFAFSLLDGEVQGKNRFPAGVSADNRLAIKTLGRACGNARPGGRELA